MAEKLYSSIIDAILDDGVDYGAANLEAAKASGDEWLDLGHKETDAAFVRAIEGNREGIFESSSNARIAKEKRQTKPTSLQRTTGETRTRPITGISSNPGDWRGKAATVCSDDEVLNDVSISIEKAKGTTVESKTRKVSDEVIRAAIRKQIAKGVSREKIASQLDKLAELVSFNRSSASEYLKEGGTAGMDYWEPNKFMEKRQFTAAEKLAESRRMASDRGQSEAPLTRVTAPTTQTATVKRAATQSTFTVEDAHKCHKAGQTLEQIYAFGTKSAGVVAASETIKKFVASLKTTNTKVALSQIDCRFLKGKLAEQNVIVGASKCGSCTYRNGMHCGLTGGTLLTFPGMDKTASKHKIADGAPKDGHQMLNDFELARTARLGDIDISGPERQEVEMGNAFKLEF